MLTEIIEFVQNYWYIVIGFAAVIAVVSINIWEWCKLPNNEQIEQVRQWLIYAVAKAEKELGSGTGQIKLRYVYNLFVTKFPAIALVISFETFSEMVDDALKEVEKLIEDNEDIEKIIKGEDENNGNV